MAMRIFLDTEFTSLERPQLLSIGMVSDVDLECYIELDLETATGQKRIAGATPFVLTQVLSQWGRERIESNVTDHLGFAAAAWLHRMAEHYNDDIELIYADKLDVDLLEESLKAAGLRWSRIAPRLQWSIVSYLHGEQFVSDAMNASWASSLEQQGIGRHHALADARALRAGFDAMHGTAEPGR
jgi:hypothetical protein